MMTALHQLYRKVVLASFCPSCRAKIGKRCVHLRRRGPLSVPHPSRQRRAGERFPEIATALQAEEG